LAERPVAFITGAARGIGRAIALELAREGFDIAGNDLSYSPGKREEGLSEVKARVEEAGAAFLPVPGDIARLEVHDRLVSAALKRFKRIDVLVNNAGVAPQKRLDILETTADSFDHVMGVNVRGAFFLTQRVARWMVGQASQASESGTAGQAGEAGQAGTAGRDGRDPASRRAVVFISSVSATFSSPQRAEYCLSKAALSHAAAVFAHRLAGHGINVYDVRPGIMKTDMTAPAAERYDKLIAEGLVPQRRWGLPEDVARAVAALARGDFAFSTGAVVDVSGGLCIQRL
jgi:NAD(P)-dependent dehydrogenase (short-subunit alcohol dehydrogenase family)